MLHQAQLEEYKMLRDDMQQRIRFRFQLFSLLLAALGFILPFGIEKQNPAVLLVYPVISFFLALSWVHQGAIMRKIGRYLRDELEPKVAGLEWEAYVNRDSKRFSQFSIIGFFASSGFILFSQALTLALAFLGMPPVESWNNLMILMTAVACLATLLTLFYLIVYSRMKR
jgi:hypothetical protein